MLKNQEINIRDRKSMISMSDTLNIEWDREQLKKYDYTFYF